MKFRTLPQFMVDYKRLPSQEKAVFVAVLKSTFIAACDEYARNPAHYVWPASLRFERIIGTQFVCAITWSFSGPDGRATFQFDTVDGEVILVWRRVGRHQIYRNP